MVSRGVFSVEGLSCCKDRETETVIYLSSLVSRALNLVAASVGALSGHSPAASVIGMSEQIMSIASIVK